MSTDTTTTTPDPSTAAILAAVAVLAGMARDIGEAAMHMTCQEAEAVEAVLRAAGHEAAADEFIEGHSHGDDDPDDNHRARYLEISGLSADHDD